MSATKEQQELDDFLGFIALRGAAPGHTSQLTRSYFDSLLIRMSFLDSGTASTKVSLFGHEFDSPICISALSHLKTFYKAGNGMVELGKAALANNVIDFCGTGDMDEFKNILNTGAKVIRIIKPFEDIDLIMETIRVAEEGGAFAIGMDIDHSFNFEGELGDVDGKKLCCMSSDILKDIIASTKLPFVVKGILSTQDAEKAIDAGASALFVSHHHGLYNYMTPPNMMLPEISRAANGQVPIIYDGNIESGYDAFKALALGATITAVGRPLIPVVQKQGSAGVSEWLNRKTVELKGIMSRSCCTKVSDIDITHIEKTEHRF